MFYTLTSVTKRVLRTLLRRATLGCVNCLTVHIMNWHVSLLLDVNILQPAFAKDNQNLFCLIMKISVRF